MTTDPRDVTREAKTVIPEELRASGVDLGLSGAKAVLSLIPSAGGFFAELLGAVVPEQRADRFARYLAKLEAALSLLERRVTATDARNLGPQQVALFESGGTAAVRAYADSQLDRIAKLVADGMTADELEAERARQELHLIAELTDEDIVELCSRVEPYKEDAAWLARHEAALWSFDYYKRLRAAGASTEKLRELGFAVDLRVSRLTALGLLENEPSLDIDELVGRLESSREGELRAKRHRDDGTEMRLYYGRTEITALGRMALERLNLWRPKVPDATSTASGDAVE